MFAYCENNPVNGIDPTRTINWGGVIVGIGLIIGGIAAAATIGVTSIIGTVVAAAVIATGVVMSYTAATESAMVMDLSGSYQTSPGLYAKAGTSTIIDFSDNGGIYEYTHRGFGCGDSLGMTYSVGVVENFKKPEDYSRDFIDITVSNNVGIDHCFNPTKRYSKTTKATSVTFGIGKSFGIGYDYYDGPITILKWKAKKRWSLNMRYIIDRTV